MAQTVRWLGGYDDLDVGSTLLARMNASPRTTINLLLLQVAASLALSGFPPNWSAQSAWVSLSDS